MARKIIAFFLAAISPLALIYFGLTGDFSASYEVQMMPGDELLSWVKYLSLWIGVFWLGCGSMYFYLSDKYEKKLRRELRRQQSDTHYRELDAKEVLNSLASDSVWSWESYKRLYNWWMVPHFRFEEFRRAAKRGDLRTKGRLANSTEEVVIGRRYWERAWIDETSVDSPQGVSTEFDRGGEVDPYQRVYHRLSVSKDDAEEVWPKASILRKGLTTTYVGLRHLIWNIWPPTRIWQIMKSIKERKQ